MQVVGKHRGSGAEGNQEQHVLILLAGFLLYVVYAVERVPGRAEDTPDTPDIVKEVVAYTETAFLPFDKNDIPVVPDLLHVVKPPAGILLVGEIHVGTRDECVIILPSGHEQPVPPRTVNKEMCPPKPPALPYIAVKIAECIGNTDDMPFLIACQYLHQSLCQ